MMEIKQFKSGAIAADGGTVSCLVELADGTECRLGLDARIPQKPSERRIFIGEGYPPSPGLRLLDCGSPEESEVIQAIAQYLKQNVRNTDADRMAAVLLEAIHGRIDPSVKKSWLP